MKKKIIIFSILLLAFTSELFALTSEEFQTSLTDYVKYSNAIIDNGRLVYNKWLNLIDDNITVARESDLDEKVKQKYIFTFGGIDGNGGYKFFIKKQLKRLDEFEELIKILHSSIPYKESLSDSEKVTMANAYTAANEMYKLIVEEEKSLKNKINNTVSEFNSDLKISRLVKEVLE